MFLYLCKTSIRINPTRSAMLLVWSVIYNFGSLLDLDLCSVFEFWNWLLELDL